MKNYFKGHELIPEFACPNPKSKIHQEDVEEVKRCYSNPVLPKKFLKDSDDSVKKIFKKYCKNNKLEVDWKLIKKVIKNVNKIVFGQKNKYDRPRPYYFIDDISENNYSDSPSFPSGHTTTAYFLSNLLSHLFPDNSSSLSMLAELIGQSRIENGVHFPSDVSAGKLLGQILADIFINEQSEEKTQIERKGLAKFLRNKATEIYDYENKNQACKNYMYDIADYLKRSNNIEGINISQKDCNDAAKCMIQGYPIENNIHLKSIVNAIKTSLKYKDINHLQKMCDIHKSLKKDTINCMPGEIRTFKKSNSTLGNAYAEPGNIFNFSNKLESYSNPYVRHVIFEWIHPFVDGNGRLGRIILLHELDYNFSKVNDFCGKNYINNIQGFITKHKDLNSLFK